MSKAVNGLAGLAGAALLLTSSLAAPVRAGPLPDGGVTKEEMAAALKERGFAARSSTDQQGDPLIESAFEGTKFAVYFFECSKGRCASIQFAAGFVKKAVTAAKLMEWNRDKRFGRTYLDKEGDPWVEMDADVEHGATTESVVNDVGRWVAVLKEFRSFIGFKQ
jgi:hypothetical protein